MKKPKQKPKPSAKQTRKQKEEPRTKPKEPRKAKAKEEAKKQPKGKTVLQGSSGGKTTAPVVVEEDIEKELGVQAPSPDQLLEISKPVNKAISLMKIISEYEAGLKSYREELNILLHNTIPSALAAAGTNGFITQSGATVSIKDYVSGGIPKEPEKKIEAFKWLEANDAGDLIKEEVSMSFAKGQHNWASEIKAALNKLEAEYTSEQKVHPQSLYSFARERIKAGEELPLEVLGLYVGRRASIEMPKK